MWIACLLLLVGQSAGPPRVTSTDPSTVAPYRPVEITIRGDGFEAGCRVLMGSPGRLVPVRSEVENDSTIRVRLAAGLSPQPGTRQIVVDCGPGRRSGALVLTVADRDAHEERDEPDSVAVAGSVDGEAAEASPEAASDVAPRLVSLDPPSTPAGAPFTLTLMGARFEEGARVEVLANANAGTSRPPDYRPMPFPTEFASDTVLLVDFDRGFAESPKLRSVSVVNPNGRRSAPLYLGITRSLP
jgi:hypothetical protein